MRPYLASLVHLKPKVDACHFCQLCNGLLSAPSAGFYDLLLISERSNKGLQDPGNRSVSVVFYTDFLWLFTHGQ